MTLAGTFTKQRIGASAFLFIGTVLAKQSADTMSNEQRLVPLSPNASDTSAVAVGILNATVDARGGDIPAVSVLSQGTANEADLVWPIVITDQQKAAAIAQLEAAGITVT